MCLGVSFDLMFLWISSTISTEFAACLQLPNRSNYCKASYPRTQQRDQGADKCNHRLIQPNM